MLTTVYIFGSVVAFIFLLSHFLRNKELDPIFNLPGPPSLPLLGCAYLFLGDTEHILKRFTKIFDTYSSPFRIQLGPLTYVAVNDPEHIKILLTSQKTLEKDDIYKISLPWIGTGLLTAPASIWRVHRKLIQPAFNSKVLQSFVQVFQKHAEILIKEMASEIGGKEFHPIHPISSCTLNIICESAMRVSILSEKERSDRYLKAAEGAFGAIVARTFKVWLRPKVIFKRSKTAKVFYECVEYLHSVRDFIIQKRRLELESEASKPNQILGQRKPFLDLLIELTENKKNVFSDTQLREEVDTLLFGGHDTTANMSCFVLLMLASHPVVQNKVYEELYNLYGTADSGEIPVIYEDLFQMEYLERVIKETMRLFPVAPLLARKTTDELDIGNCTIPKNFSIMTSVIQLHRNEKYWPDPLKFDPDRFLPEEVDKRHPFVFVPFSSGPRNCIGLQFAMMSMKVILATVVRKYVIKTDNNKPIKDIRLKLNILLKPVEPLAIRIEKRH